jgi:hypothetical protein
MFYEGWGRRECNSKHRCLWVPAFAGTTAVFYSPSFFLRCPIVRTRAVQLLSLSSLGMCEPSPADSKPVFA